MKESRYPTEIKQQRRILLVVLLLLILLCSRGVFQAYSYWHDELFSIGAANASSWHVLFKEWILPDTHPPLHLTLLRLWVGMFGSGEIPTRFLSLIPAWLSLIAIAWTTQNGGFARQIIAILFLGTSPLFSLYAQEVRPYSWTLLFATVSVGVMTILWRSQQQGPSVHLPRVNALRLCFIVSLLLLSLSHYFGFFYALTLLVLDVLRGAPCLGRRRWGLALLPALFAWPLLHVLVGGAGGGRTSWIVSQPVIGVFSTAMNGAFPAFPAAVVVIVLAMLISAVGRQRRSRDKDRGLQLRDSVRGSSEACWLLSGAAGFLGLISLIDLVKPLAVERYFIVLLPCFALALGDVGQRLIASGSPYVRRATVCVLAIIISMHFWHSQEVLSAKIYPLQNYKYLARFIGETGVCRQGCTSVSAKKHRLVPYFDSIPLQRVDPEGVNGFSAVRLPFVGLHGDKELIQPLLAAHSGASCWEPRQFTALSTFIVIPESAHVRPQSFGLRQCVQSKHRDA